MENKNFRNLKPLLFCSKTRAVSCGIYRSSSCGISKCEKPTLTCDKCFHNIPYVIFKK